MLGLQKNKWFWCEGRFRICHRFLDPGGGVSIPIGINYLAGKSSHYFEAGLGATIYTLKGLTLFNEDLHEGGVIFVPGVGYRYQPLQNGFTFRIFVSPLIGNGSTFWAGISAGYKFLNYQIFNISHSLPYA
jgi:hypothetical protein